MPCQGFSSAVTLAAPALLETVLVVIGVCCCGSLTVVEILALFAWVRAGVPGFT